MESAEDFRPEPCARTFLPYAFLLSPPDQRALTHVGYYFSRPRVSTGDRGCVVDGEKGKRKERSVLGGMFIIGATFPP